MENVYYTPTDDDSQLDMMNSSQEGARVLGVFFPFFWGEGGMHSISMLVGAYC